MVFDLQPGLSLSSFRHSDFQNSDIIPSFELDWDRAIYTLPSESTAVIIVTLGVTWNAFTEFLESGACHFRLRQSLMPSYKTKQGSKDTMHKSFLT